ncbi:MAG: sensor histidine kinase [Ekhidna sp.]|nr:sensor histidine kinase [Ekhidna sp.]
MVSLEFDSSRYYLSKTPPAEAKVLAEIIDLWEIAGQEKRQVDYLDENDLDGNSPQNQLLLGTQQLYEGDKSRASSLLLKSYDAFQSEEDELAIISKLNLLYLHSRIIMGNDEYNEHLADFQKYLSFEEAKAWYHIHRLKLTSKILDIDSAEQVWPNAFAEASKFFQGTSLNSNILAHWLLEKGVYLRYYGRNKEAIKVLKKGVEYCSNKAFLRSVKFSSLLDLANIYQRTNKLDSARVYLQKAGQNWDYSDTNLSELNYQVILAGGFYISENKWDSAYYSLRKVCGLNLQRFFESNNIRMSELSEEYEADKRELEILTQKKQISQKNRWLLVIAFFLAISTGLAIGLVMSYKKIRSKNQKIETLMRELHHRVKNNLQVISSMLGLQSMKLKDASARKAVTEGKDRLRAMSLIHQKLYQNEDAISLNIKEYISNLVMELAQSYGYQNKTKFLMDIPSIELDADDTLPLGLIVNELVSNSFKYAFKDVAEPELEIRLLQESEKDFSFFLRDNGPGLPEDFDIEKSNSFGTKLVSILVKQLNGELRCERQEGLAYHISFQLKQ